MGWQINSFHPFVRRRKNRVGGGRSDLDDRARSSKDPWRGVMDIMTVTPQDPIHPMDDDPHYQRIADAIAFAVAHAIEQPSLEMMADKAGLSPFHFQRLFKRRVGISPKRFLQYVTLAEAKKALAGQAS